MFQNNTIYRIFKNSDFGVFWSFTEGFPEGSTDLPKNSLKEQLINKHTTKN